jgi:hypothetical protein
VARGAMIADAVRSTSVNATLQPAHHTDSHGQRPEMVLTRECLAPGSTAWFMPVPRSHEVTQFPAPAGSACGEEPADEPGGGGSGRWNRGSVTHAPRLSAAGARLSHLAGPLCQ